MTLEEAEKYLEDKAYSRNEILGLLSSDLETNKLIRSGLIVQSVVDGEVMEEITGRGATAFLGLLVRLTVGGKAALIDDVEQLMVFLDAVVPAFNTAADVFTVQGQLDGPMAAWKAETGQ